MSSYITTPPHWRIYNVQEGRLTFDPGHDWEAHTLDRLTWRYGPERARAIFNGEDPQANADQLAWASLGERKAVA